MIKKHVPFAEYGTLEPGQENTVFEATCVLESVRAHFSDPNARLRVWVNGYPGSDDSPYYDYINGWVHPNQTWFVPLFETRESGGAANYAVQYQPHNTSLALVKVALYNPTANPVQVLEGVVEYWDER